MYSDQQQPFYRSDEPEYLSSDFQDNSGDEEDEDEKKKPGPPLYICICRNDPQCNNLHPHPLGPKVYVNYTPQTPCRFCGHVGTLQRVN